MFLHRQSSIGVVSSGSVFSTFQSLGTRILGRIWFGVAGVGFGRIGSEVHDTRWCTCKQSDTSASNDLNEEIFENDEENEEIYDKLRKFQWIKCYECNRITVSALNLNKIRESLSILYIVLPQMDRYSLCVIFSKEFDVDHFLGFLKTKSPRWGWCTCNNSQQ